MKNGILEEIKKLPLDLQYDLIEDLENTARERIRVMVNEARKRKKKETS